MRTFNDQLKQEAAAQIQTRSEKAGGSQEHIRSRGKSAGSSSFWDK